LDESIKNLGMTVLKSPPHSPKANAICERVIGTIRRECLDWLIPLSESHLRSMLKVWVTHYNGARPQWRWARVFPIRLQAWYCPPRSDPGIIWAREQSYALARCWAACIVSIRSRPLWPERVFAHQADSLILRIRHAHGEMFNFYYREAT